MPIVITGLKELSDALTTQTNAAAKRYLSNVLQPAADIVVEACKETAPVKIGILEESIVTQKKFKSGDGETTANIAIGPLKSIFYGTFQEWGTRFEPPQFWMTRAWESSKEAVLDKFVEGAKEMLEFIKAK